jgi:antibiotic biosynthesis monooxygenase (ABM) superfamily enzyme
MGIIRSTFSFMVGTICGIYIAQNYSVPNLNKLAKAWLSDAKQVEEAHRIPEKKD